MPNNLDRFLETRVHSGNKEDSSITGSIVYDNDHKTC